MSHNWHDPFNQSPEPVLIVAVLVTIYTLAWMLIQIFGGG